MRLSAPVRIALTLLPLMRGRVRMDDLIRWIARYHLPHRKSVTTLRRLVKAGILDAHRGVGGGYELTRAFAEITVAQIIEAVEGPIFPASNGPEPVCRVTRIFRQKINDELRRMTLADLV